jgi:hypothetical protein
MLPQIPRLALMRSVLRNSDQENMTTLHIDLLASAIHNSADASSAPSRRPRIETTRIADRIRNCITIASQIGLPENSPFADPSIRPGDLMHHLCAAASTSRYCQEYMYIPSSYNQRFTSFAEGDAYLEAALLVASGYTAEPVLHTMKRLVKEGKLIHIMGARRRIPVRAPDQLFYNDRWNRFEYEGEPVVFGP